MWTVAVCRNVGAICFASILMRPLQLASAACPVVPKGGFPIATELNAMKCINPDAISGVPITSGHLILNGLQDISSKDLECESTDKELKALINGTAAASLSLGASTCSLVAVGLSKRGASVVMRLDFNKCTLGQYDTSIFIKVVKAAPGGLHTPTFVPFLNQVCEPKGFAAEKQKEKFTTNYVEVQVGSGRCVGTVMKTIKSVAKKDICKMLCSANIQTHGSSEKATRLDGCTGFTFDSKNSAGDNCFLYNGTKVTAVAPQKINEGFKCWNLTAYSRVVVASTTAPPTLKEQKALDAALPRLNVNVDLQAKSASVLTFFPTDPNCSSPFNEVDIQDQNFQTISVSVKNSEWAKLLARIPSPTRRLAIAGAEKASYVLTDRLVYGSSGSMAAPPIPAPIVNVLAPTTPMPCRKVPAKVSNATTVFIINLILGVVGIGAAIASFEMGKKWAASAKTQSYEPLPK
jgi:hypothetical protein